MSKDAKNVPALRFKGFSDAWEKRKLGDMAKKVVEKNKSGEFKEVLTNSAENGIISQRDFFDKDIANKKSLNGYYVVRPDDFVYNPRISNSAPVGPIKRNRLNRTGIMSPLYFVFRVHNVNHGFLEQYFSANVWHHFMTQNGDTGARSDRFAIKDSVFVTMPILIPSVAEQQQIASSLQALDGLIAATQGKLDQLEMLKKALLQHLFDQSMRFKGYSDPWEKRKAKELFTPSSEKGQSNLPVVSVTQDQGVVFRNSLDIDIKYDKTTLSSYKVVRPGDFIISLRSFQGGFELSNIKGITSPAYTIFKFKSPEEHFLNFWKYFFKRYSFIQSLESVTFGIRDGRSISFKDFSDLKIIFPNSKKEEEGIARSLDLLDSLIAATQSKLSSFESLKKALLQGLFI